MYALYRTFKSNAIGLTKNIQNLNERGAAYIPIAKARGFTPHFGNFYYEINLTKSTVAANHRPHCDKLMVSPQKVAFKALKKDADTVKYRFVTVCHSLNLTNCTVDSQ